MVEISETGSGRNIERQEERFVAVWEAMRRKLMEGKIRSVWAGYDRERGIFIDLQYGRYWMESEDDFGILIRSFGLI